MARNPRILVVDDDRSQCAILEDALTTAGYKVAVAGNASQALELLESTLAKAPTAPPTDEHVDLVLLDILMPGVQGTEVLQHIRRFNSAQLFPVIMATAKDEPEDIVEALRSGANDYIAKPVNLPVLLARVDTQLALRRAHQNLRDAQQSLIHAARMESVALLAAGVADEIHAPFLQLRTGLETLQHGLPPADGKVAATLEDMTTALERADGVIGSLTRFSAADRLDLQPRDARQVVEEAVELLLTDLADADIYVETDFDPSLPAAFFASEELRQVLVIVLLNAIEAMPDLGSIMIRTNVQTAAETTVTGNSGSDPGIRRGDEVVCIEVLDSGTGLASEDSLAPFNAFYTTKNSRTSAGLGLTIAKKLVDLHGGLIKIANRDDEEGACVTIALRPATASNAA